MSHTQYIQRAFDSELKLAGVMPASGAPRIVLSGTVTHLAFGTVTAPGARDAWAKRTPPSQPATSDRQY